MENEYSDLIYLMNIQYMYLKIYIKQILIIQKNIRMVLNMHKYFKMKHQLIYMKCLHDIIELAFLPPIRDNVLLLKDGAYFYREGLINFTNNIN